MFPGDILWYPIDKVFSRISKVRVLWEKEKCFASLLLTNFLKLIKWGSLILCSYELNTSLMICLAKKKNCQIIQGLINELMTVLRPMGSIYCAIQDLFSSLPTLKDHFSLLFFYAGNYIVSENELIMSWLHLLKYLPMKGKK